VSIKASQLMPYFLPVIEPEDGFFVFSFQVSAPSLA
jgi:hypothetical protein